jgi:two-component sensor histidine kinase
VKNNLQVVSSLLALQADSSDDATVARLLAAARTRVSTIALIHTTLCENPSASAIDMKRFVQDLVDNVRRTYADLAASVTIVVDLDPLTLPLRWATPCGLLISELLTNAFKHAFADPIQGRIDLRLGVQNGVVTIVVRDDGRGLPGGVEHVEGSGVGLPLIRLLATRQLRGALSIDRTGGTAFTVRFNPFAPSAQSAKGTGPNAGGHDA